MLTLFLGKLILKGSVPLRAVRGAKRRARNGWRHSRYIRRLPSDDWFRSRVYPSVPHAIGSCCRRRCSSATPRSWQRGTLWRIKPPLSPTRGAPTGSPPAKTRFADWFRTSAAVNDMLGQLLGTRFGVTHPLHVSCSVRSEVDQLQSHAKTS